MKIFLGILFVVAVFFLVDRVLLFGWKFLEFLAKRYYAKEMKEHIPSDYKDIEV